MAIAHMHHLDRAAYLLAALFTLFVFVFGWQFHPVQIGGAENDHYVERAEALLAGELPADPYRPLLYPLLAAAGGAVLGGDTFVAAKLVSNLAAGGLVLLCYLIGRSCFGREVGLFALICAITNTQLIQAGVLAATDVLFSALSALVLLLALRTTDELRLSRAALLGAVFALAFFTRYTALAVLPAIGLALVLAPASLDRKLKAFAVFGLSAGLVLVPHMALTYAVFDAPFYTETWKNLAFKLYGNGDWSYLQRVPFDSLTGVIANDPLLFVRSALFEGYRFATDRLPALLGNSDLLLTGTLFTAMFVLGLYRLVFALDRKLVVLFTYFLVNVGLVAVFYLVKLRLLLPILPVAYAVAGFFAVKVAFPWLVQVGRHEVKSYAPLLAVLVLLQGGALVKQLHGFVAQHPWEEIRAQKEAARTVLDSHASTPLSSASR